MSGKVELQGYIGNNKNMMPTSKPAANGGRFRSFKMWAENYTLKMNTLEDGSKERQRFPYEVRIPDNAWGAKIWPHILAGRKVFTKGRGGFKPNIGTTRDGEKKAYANPYICADELLFLDEKITTSAKRVFNVLMTEYNLINDDQKDRFYNSIKEHEGTLQRNEAPSSQEETPHEAPTESSDPDKLDIPT